MHGYQPKLKAEADNTNRNLIIPDITKTESNNFFIKHCFEENNDKRIIERPHKSISTLGLIPFCRVAPGYFSL